MLGLLLWKTGGKRPVTVGERRVLRVRFVWGEVERGTGPLTRLRVRRALGQLRRRGVTEVVLPEGFPWRGLAEEAGLRPVSTLPLRRLIAADWLTAALEAAGIRSAAVSVAVTGDSLTGEMARTVTELALRYRYVLLELRRGGEDLQRRLRREYGVSLQLHPAPERLAQAEAVVEFLPGGPGSWPVRLRLWEEEGPLPELRLPPALEAQLPAGVDRGQLLSALRQAGALRPGQLTVSGVQGGEKGRNPPLSGETFAKSLQIPPGDRP